MIIVHYSTAIPHVPWLLEMWSAFALPLFTAGRQGLEQLQDEVTFEGA